MGKPWENGGLMGFYGILLDFMRCYPLVMTDIAVKCPVFFWEIILNFKYLLEIMSPIVEWWLFWTFTTEKGDLWWTDINHVVVLHWFNQVCVLHHLRIWFMLVTLWFFDVWKKNTGFLNPYINHHRSYINGQLSRIMLNNENGEIYGEGE